MENNFQVLSDIGKIITSLSEKSKLKEDALVNNIVKYLVVNNVGASDETLSKLALTKFGKRVDSNAVKKAIRAGFYNRFGKSYLTVRTNSSQSLAKKLYDVLFNNGDYSKLEEEYENTKKYSETVQLSVFAFVGMLSDKKLLECVIKLDKPFSCDCFETIASYAKVELSNDISDYEKEILRLESERNRANNLISRLQEEFDERLEESKKEEQDKLIQELNSSRYDGILDQLTTLQNGLKQLRREHIAVPMQINTLQSFVRNMLQFVEDCGITPMMDLGEELEISALETEYYEYRGEPFTNNSEKKKVVVVATGWENREKNIIISQPTVQEVLSEANNIDMQLEVDDKEAQSAGEYEEPDVVAEQHSVVASEEKTETTSLEDKKNGSESAILESENNASFEEELMLDVSVQLSTSAPIKTDVTEICGKVEQNNEIVTVNGPRDSESVEPKDIISETHEQLIDGNEQKAIANDLETDDQNATSAPTGEAVAPEEPANNNKLECEKDLAGKKEGSKTHTNSYKKQNHSSDNESALSQPEKTEKATKIANNKSQLQIFGDYCLTKFSEGKKAFQLEDFTEVIKSNNISMVQKRLNELCNLGFMIFNKRNGYEWIGTKENWDEHWKKLNDRHANNNSGRKNK